MDEWLRSIILCSCNYLPYPDYTVDLVALLLLKAVAGDLWQLVISCHITEGEITILFWKSCCRFHTFIWIILEFRLTYFASEKQSLGTVTEKIVNIKPLPEMSYDHCSLLCYSGIILKYNRIYFHVDSCVPLSNKSMFLELFTNVTGPASFNSFSLQQGCTDITGDNFRDSLY